MCVDDLVCQGAEPLFFLDYISTGDGGPGPDGRAGGRGGRGVPPGGRRPPRRRDGRAPRGDEARASSTWSGSPSAWSSGTRCWARPGSEPGDVLIGLPSPGLRCNGYSLARHVLLRAVRPRPRRPGLARRSPSRWPTSCSGRRSSTPRRCGPPSPPRGTDGGVHAVAHITGGGFEGNVPRALPDGPGRVLDRGTWEVPPIFGEIRRLGNVADRRDGPGVQPRPGHGPGGRRRPRRRCARRPSAGPAVDADGGGPGRGRASAGVELVGPAFWSARRSDRRPGPAPA